MAPRQVSRSLEHRVKFPQEMAPNDLRENRKLHLYGSSPKLYFTDTDTNVESQIDTDSGGGNFAINVDVTNSILNG